MTEIGKKIKGRREELAKSQQELASELGINQSQLSQVERGKPTTLSVEKLEFICDYLEIEHTKRKLKDAKGGISEEQEKIKEKPKERTREIAQGSNILKLLEGKHEENREMAIRYEIAADVYQEVIQMIKEGAE